MLKIVDIHRSSTAQGEYVVLQNQGLTTVTLRGWALCTDAWLDGDPELAAREMYIFSQPVPIKPYTRVVLFSGCGEEGWHPTSDGKYAYLVYWNRGDSAWSQATNLYALHISSSRKVVDPADMLVGGHIG